MSEKNSDVFGVFIEEKANIDEVLINVYSAVVVIPIYKINFDTLELISLRQVMSVLKKWPIVLVMPEKFCGKLEIPGIECRYFPDENFKDITSYSHLLLTEMFYAEFDIYDYMLIYQTDAFVFSDCLEEFCDLGFDYIGAPWPRFMAYPEKLFSRVGNGGFSLRKVKSMRRAVRIKEQLLSELSELERYHMEAAEDRFFAYCGARDEIEFKIPDVKTALKFSFEHEIGHCYTQLQRKLPFGCHAWTKYNYHIWKPIIERYGYTLPGIMSGATSLGCRKHIITMFLSSRIIRGEKRNKYHAAMLEIIPTERKLSIWGAGQDGRRCFSLLHGAGIKVRKMYDKRANDVQIDGIKVEKLPNEEIIQAKTDLLIIATSAHELEISRKLLMLGLKKNIDFIFFSEMEKQLIAMVYKIRKRF